MLGGVCEFRGFFCEVVFVFYVGVFFWDMFCRIVEGLEGRELFRVRGRFIRLLGFIVCCIWLLGVVGREVFC